MNMFLTLAYLFFIGSTLGWVAELLYRRFLSGANPERKWINPGFCVGPYVPLYGSGLCILYLLASVSSSTSRERCSYCDCSRPISAFCCCSRAWH